jgi:hypothetical protein
MYGTTYLVAPAHRPEPHVPVATTERASARPRIACASGTSLSKVTHSSAASLRHAAENPTLRRAGRISFHPSRGRVRLNRRQAVLRPELAALQRRSIYGAMRTIAVIGSGQAGLLAAHGVLRAGLEVTLYCDRSPEQWLEHGRPTGPAVRSGCRAQRGCASCSGAAASWCSRTYRSIAASRSRAKPN